MNGSMERLRPGTRRLLRAAAPLAAATAVVAMGGCVRVSAPDKPIEINLDINIRQEVVVRLAQDVRDLKQKQPGEF